MKPFWYLCATTGNIKYAGEFADFDDCDAAFPEAIWIWGDHPPTIEGQSYS